MGTLVLTHYVPPLMPGQEDAWRALAAAHFDGPIVHGHVRLDSEWRYANGWRAVVVRPQVVMQWGYDQIEQVPAPDGERLHLSEKTVRNHVSQLLRKLGFQRRSQAAAWAGQRRLELPPE